MSRFPPIHNRDKNPPLVVILSNAHKMRVTGLECSKMIVFFTECSVLFPVTECD